MSRRIKASSVRGLSALTPFLKSGDTYNLTLKISDITPSVLKASGCPKVPKPGISFLPSPIGKHTGLNCQVTEVTDKSGHKESVYRMVYTTWNDWHGHSHSGVVSRRYSRWPRIPIPPPEEQLYIVLIAGELHVSSRACSFKSDEEDRNIHLLNIFLELFGECDVIDEKGQTLLAPKIRRVNWDLLPVGDFPWAKVESHVASAVDHLSTADQAVIQIRLRHIARHEPTKIAVGRGGFRGYFAFEFKGPGLVILESVEFDNATYVFGSDWERVSQLTKKEILMSKLQKERLVHSSGWKVRVTRLFR